MNVQSSKDILAALVGFDTVSRNSNLDLIAWVEETDIDGFNLSRIGSLLTLQTGPSARREQFRGDKVRRLKNRSYSRAEPEVRIHLPPAGSLVRT